MQRFHQWIILKEAEYSLTYYHGTGFDNLPIILKNGLLQKKPIQGDPAVYLTPNIDLAARYAVGEVGTHKFARKPAILELNVSPTPQVIRKMAYDPMDRPDNAWDYDPSESAEYIAVREVEDEVARFVKKINPRVGYYHFDLDQFANKKREDLFQYNGINLYQILFQIIAETFQFLDKKKIYGLIRQSFPAGKFNDFFQITPSGTLRVTPGYLTNLNQYQYFHKLPPSAIKYIWVKEDDFPGIKGLEKKDIAVEELPHETRDKFDALAEMYDKIYDFIMSSLQDEYYDELDFNKDLDEWIEEVEEKDGPNGDDAIDILEEIRKLFSNRKDNAEEIEQAAQQLREFAPYDRWGNTTIKEKNTWIKILPQDIGKLKTATP